MPGTYKHGGQWRKENRVLDVPHVCVKRTRIHTEAIGIIARLHLRPRH